MASFPYPGQALVYEHVQRVQACVDVFRALINDAAWFHKNQGTNCSFWLGAFDEATQPGTEDGVRVSASERAVLLAATFPDGLSVSNIVKFIDRWNRSQDYYAAGITNVADVPAGWSTDFIARDVMQAKLAAAREAVLKNEADGFTNTLDGLKYAVDRLRSDVTIGNAVPAAPAGLRAASAGGGICARVKLQINQEAVITRDAFKATLELQNGSGSVLGDVRVDLVVRDSAGALATSLFGIGAPALAGIGDVNGAGQVLPGTTASAAWILVPTSDAAPTGPVQYQVSGTLTYIQDGTTVTIPLSPSPITVHPSPSLVLKYFHERDVLADDPFTDEVEPSVPYSLAVMVQNQGLGTARNLRITSSQPKIVENEKGLLIDFNIIAIEVAGQNLTPSLTANFGDVLPGQIKVGRWLLKSTLQGQFIDYNATFEHLDALGDPRLSLIQGVEIHELIHLVRADGAFEDGQPDFLVNDFQDDEFLRTRCTSVTAPRRR